MPPVRRENTLLYPDVWKKSFLIEIVYDDGGMESFTFSLPPKGIEITITQRKTETETFGGLYVDDYGIGKGKIRLSGNTGNSNLKRIYRGQNQGETWFTGKEEIYHLRDKIIRYKESGRWERQKSPAKINLYNLGANYGGLDESATDEMMKTASIDAWEVILDEFKLTQSDDKPFVHNYSIDFTAVRIIGESKILNRVAPRITQAPDLKRYEKPLDNIEKNFAFYEKPLDNIGNNLASNETIMDKIRKVRNTLNIFNDRVKRYLALVNNTIDNYMRDFVGPVYSVIDIYNTFKQVTMAPADIALRMVQTTKDLRKAVENTIKDIQSLPEQWSERYESFGKSIESEINAYKNYFEDNMQELENAANEAYTEAASGANPEITIVPNTGTSPGAEGSPTRDESGSDGDTGSTEGGGGTATGTVQTVVAYGYMRHIANSETTLEKLAAMYLGDPDKAQMLAIINGITGDDEISPGDQIKIPILTENSLNTLNQIFGSTNNRDTLGIDIALANGILQIGPNGDFVQQVEYENMNQAISMRLSESIGNRIRLNTYGIRNVAGIPDSVAAAYICTSIKDTVMQDPRVDRVENLYFKGTGDALFVSFDYYTYDGVLRRYEGGL